MAKFVTFNLVYYKKCKHVNLSINKYEIISTQAALRYYQLPLLWHQSP